MKLNKTNLHPPKNPVREFQTPDYPRAFEDTIHRRRFFEIIGGGVVASVVIGCGQKKDNVKSRKKNVDKASGPGVSKSKADYGPDLSLPGGEDTGVKAKLEAKQLQVQTVRLKDRSMLSYVLLFSFDRPGAQELAQENRNKILFTADRYLKNNCNMDSVSSLVALEILNTKLKPLILEVLAAAPPSYFALKMVRVRSSEPASGTAAL